MTRRAIPPPDDVLRSLYCDQGMSGPQMEDRGGATANHEDHPHVSFEAEPGGAV